MKFLLLTLGSVFSLVASGQDGLLDPSFGSGGKSFSGFFGSTAWKMPIAIQPDGKIIQATTTMVSGTHQGTLIRYKINGQPDSSFGAAGRLTTAFNTGFIPYDLALQADGKIVMGGQTNYGNTNHFAAVRINGNGTVDASFGNNGQSTISFNNEQSQVTSVAIQPDGKIILGGHASIPPAGSIFLFALARLNTDGSLDTSFDLDGKQMTPIQSNDIINDLVIQADGKIVAAGMVHKPTSPILYEIAVVRYTGSGSLDNTFSVGGIFTGFKSNYPFMGANTVALQSDGKIVLGASYHNGFNLDFMVVRLTASGKPDSTFGNLSWVSTPIGTDKDEVFSVAVQSDGKIVAAGDIFVPTINSDDVAVVRYNPSGSLDISFGTNGKTIVDMNSGSDDEWGLIASQGSKIIVGVKHHDAAHNQNPALFRLNNSSAFFDPLACTVLPAAPSISISGTVLTSSAPNNNQWYLNGIAIPGATNQTYTATTSGMYTATVTLSGCNSTASNTITINVTGISSPSLDRAITMAPNPVSDKMIISFIGPGKLYLEVLDLSGRLLLARQLFISGDELDFSGYASGTYLIRIINKKINEKVQRLVVKQ